MKNRLFTLLFLLSGSSICQSQENQSNFISNQTLQEEIIQLVKNTPKKDLVSIVGRYEFGEQVLRAENLVFHNESELVFTNYDLPYIVIAAKNLKFNTPQIKSVVTFGSFDIGLLKGGVGASGSNGKQGKGNGANGTPGSPGETGKEGNTKKIPDIYIIIENISTDLIDISHFDWQVIANGIEGGQGGNGGIGGEGGQGVNGRNASDSFGTCKAGGQNGGKGGNAGAGGQGGIGGKGGDATKIYLVGIEQVIEKLTYAKYSLKGGIPGKGGESGKSGAAGSGGSGGNGSHFCHGGNPGGNGAVPKPLGLGSEGIAKGIDGEVKIIVRNNSDLF